ncbi:prolyl oligopeptidase family serine peptidase [Microlunatus sp. GCM10028923]|uniref:prolyl oligopeptidase family serine peptidase n=1 Tax=Microlunatus sp. GCM10028923 TaxID=3273400 RepID=UPI00360D0A2F
MPRRSPEPVPFTCFVGVEYARVGGIRLCLEILGPLPLPTVPVPVIVRIDGCPAWGPGPRSAAMVAPFANPLLAERGFLTVAMTPRNSSQAVFPAPLDDVLAAISWLRANPLGLPVDPQRIGLWGHSAGGHLAALAGLTSSSSDTDVQAVVTISGPTSLIMTGGELVNDRPSPVTALVGGDLTTHRQQLLAASPLSHVTADAPPFLIIHGTADETVPFDQAVNLHEALRRAGAGSTLVPFDGRHHNLALDPEARDDEAGWFRAGRLAADFFTRSLRRNPPLS